MKNILQDSKNIYFIGIGGIGVSAIARMMLKEGKHVSGSDISRSEIINELEKLGAKFEVGQNVDMIPDDTDLIIYSPAVTIYDPKLLDAIKKKKIPALTYPETLREISKDKYTIAVSGTHGKTTTTAMIAKMMIDAGLDPTVIVGSLIKSPEVSPQGAKRGEVSPRGILSCENFSKDSPSKAKERPLKKFQTNFIAGKSKYFIVESCEYQKSFLNIKPTIALITNIDNDHLDFYKDLEAIQNAFKEFISQVEESGYIISDIKHKTVCPLIKNLKANIINSKDYFKENLKLKIPGKHNKENASLALAVAKILGIDKKKAKKSLENFSGTWRRFEYKGKTKKGILVYDDYGHHPTEVKATLSGAREFFGKKKIFVVFQPHLFSRTKLLLNDFAKAFKDADEVLLAPIYSAREKFDPSISSEILADKIRLSLRAKRGNPASSCHSRGGGNLGLGPRICEDGKRKVISFANFNEIENYLSKKLKKGNVLLTMGAGDVYKIGETLVKN